MAVGKAYDGQNLEGCLLETAQQLLYFLQLAVKQASQ